MNIDKTQGSCHTFIYLSYLSYDTYSVSHSQVTFGVDLHMCFERSLSDMGCDNIYADSFYMPTVLSYTQISVQCLQPSHKGSVLYHFQHHPNIRRFIYIYIYTGCNRRNGPDFGRLFLMLNYTENPQNTYIQS